jgi:hypothetical protein
VEVAVRQTLGVGATFAIVLGLVLIALGATLLTDFRRMGTLIVDKTIPDSLRTGTPERYRKMLGYAYSFGGVVFAVVGIVVLAK